MKFEESRLYKIYTDKSKKFFTKDEFAVFIHTQNLSYRYISSTPYSGILELFNDSVNLVFKVRLYA